MMLSTSLTLWLIGAPPPVDAEQRFLTQACDDGIGHACRALAEYWLLRDRHREAAALDALKRGCKLDDEESCVRAANLEMSHGQSSDNDMGAMQGADGHLQLACGYGSSNACVRLLALKYSAIAGVPLPAPSEGDALRAACALPAATPAACRAYARYLVLALDEPFAVDEEFSTTRKAATLADRWCRAGVAHECYQYGYALLSDAVDVRDARAAVQHFKVACDGGDASGCLLAGTMYLPMSPFVIDWVQADLFLARACQLGDPRACERRSTIPKNRTAPLPAAFPEAELATRLQANGIALARCLKPSEHQPVALTINVHVDVGPDGVPTRVTLPPRTAPELHACFDNVVRRTQLPRTQAGVQQARVRLRYDEGADYVWVTSLPHRRTPAR